MTIISEPKDFDRLLEEASRNDEVSFQWGRLSPRQREDIRREIQGKRLDLLATANVECLRHADLSAKLEKDLVSVQQAEPQMAAWLSFLANRKISLSIVVVLALLGLMAAAGLRFSWPLNVGPLLNLPVAVSTVSLVLLLYFPLLWGPRAEREHKAAVLQARTEAASLLDVKGTEQRVKDAEEKIREVVRDKGILSLIRTAISQLPQSFSTELKIDAAPGLENGERQSLEVETPAHAELRHVLESWDRGSIGIAGPRGAGKSTLIHTFCRSRGLAGDTDAVLGVAASAPVEYQGRDFLLHLFATICHRVLEWEHGRTLRVTGGSSLAYDRFDWKKRATSLSNQPRHPLLPLLTRVSQYAGGVAVCLAAVAISLAVMQAGETVNQSTAAPSQGASAVAVVSSNTRAAPAASASSAPRMAVASSAPTASPESSAASAPAGAGTAQSPASTAKDGRSPVSLVGAMGRELGITTQGLFTCALWLGGIWVLGFSARKLSPQGPIGERDFEYAYRWSRGPELQAVTSAESWLEEIKFQNSFTAGWAGGAKLPIGVEASTTRGRSMSQAPLTLPEIADGFTHFLGMVRRDLNCKIVIGIDELDKLADSDKAQRFLNEIKAVFGVDGVFYLISVSEDAMSQFERRGLPFRDAFDSSFDKVIGVDFLAFEDSRRLLGERIVGLPVPFQALCYCLSGGLARELVRTCRELVKLNGLAGTSPKLSALTGLLVRKELDGKLKAVSHAAAAVSLEPQRSDLLSKLNLLRVSPINAAALHKAHADLRAEMFVATGEDGNGHAQQLQVLADEIGCYCYFLALVIEFFTDDLDEERLTRAVRGSGVQPSHIDKMAGALQSLAVSPRLARSIVDSLRT